MRLFVALDLPLPVRQHIAILAGGIPGGRWVKPANYHLTLRFIGEQPLHRAEEIDAALATLNGQSFKLILSGVGTFEKAGRTTMLWLGVARNEALERLRAKIEMTLVRTGLEPERRRFFPHVSLARLENPAEARVATYVQAHNLFRVGPIAIDAFTLFRSQLGKEQAVYTAEVVYPLRPQARPECDAAARHAPPRVIEA